MNDAMNARTEGCKASHVQVSAFTRDKKLGAKRLLMILLHRIDMTLQPDIDKFFKHIECP
jgi:hypothetical protein